MKERYYSESLLRSLAYEDNVNGNCDGKIDFTVIDCLSGADVAPVVHGEWECDYDCDLGETIVTCSNCKNSRRIEGCYVGIHNESLYDEDTYCPNCGAKMDGGKK